jgi:NAD(P)-dependent dehydrogenase (short-subunit alcohol dehydrogenase family)
VTADGLFEVAGRVVVLTGAAGILGREIAAHLCRQGARVVGLDLRLAPAPEGAEAEDRFFPLVGDVTSTAAMGDCLERLTRRWGPPQGLINAAALDSPPDGAPEDTGPVETLPDAVWERVMRANTTGTFVPCKVFGGEMARQGRGSIVNVGSIYGLVSPQHDVYAHRPGFFKPIGYAASKSALLNLTRYLATYWARRNVRVNTVTLGGVWNDQPAPFVAAYGARVPLGRMARRSEYNGVFQFLLSDASSYVTGANLVADGGWTAW